MALTTYAELQTEIANFLNRDDLTTSIPSFITLAETSMNREIRHYRMEKRSTANVNAQFSSLPVDFLESIRLTLNTAETDVLQIVNSLEISKLRAASGNTTAKPINYALLDGSIELFPTPDATYVLEILYYGTINPLNNQNTSNWVLQYHPDVYLYGALMHSAPYLQEDERAQTWAAFYKSGINMINQESENAKTSGSGRKIQIRSYA